MPFPTMKADNTQLPKIIPGTRLYSASSPKLEARTLPMKGRSVFCIERIEAEEFVGAIGGRAITLAEAMRLPATQRKKCLQIEDDLVLWSANEPEGLADWINHSCDPNLGMIGNSTFMAVRAIQPGEEVCYDYCTVDASMLDEFECHCGSFNCRGFVSGNDWKKRDLQERYSAFFSSFLKRRFKTSNASPA